MDKNEQPQKPIRIKKEDLRNGPYDLGFGKDEKLTKHKYTEIHRKNGLINGPHEHYYDEYGKLVLNHKKDGVYDMSQEKGKLVPKYDKDGHKVGGYYDMGEQKGKLVRKYDEKYKDQKTVFRRVYNKDESIAYDLFYEDDGKTVKGAVWYGKTEDGQSYKKTEVSYENGIVRSRTTFDEKGEVISNEKFDKTGKKQNTRTPNPGNLGGMGDR